MNITAEINFMMIELLYFKSDKCNKVLLGQLCNK